MINMKEKRKKSVLILILVIAGLFAFIFIAGKTNITQFITPTYKLASTPYATLIYIGNGSVKVGGIAEIKFIETKHDNLIGDNYIYFPYTNITIDNKTFAVLNESISFNSKLQEIKQKLSLSYFASNNGTLYYVRLVNFSNYYGVIIPANFMNKSYVSLPFTITPYPTCPIISKIINPPDVVFNKLITDFNFANYGISIIYAYSGIIIFKNSTGSVGNRQYFGCVKVDEQIPSWGLYICGVNNVSFNCTYFNYYNNIVNENPVYPQIKFNQTFVYNKNNTETGLDFPN